MYLYIIYVFGVLLILGKFEMQVLTRVGHAVQEDDPDKVASILSNFLVRNKFTNPTSEFVRYV